MNKKLIPFSLIFFILITIIVFYFKFKKEDKLSEIKSDKSEEIFHNSNIIKDVNYVSKTEKGNEYIINALQGEIDFSNNDIIYLTKVKALIKLNNSKNILIKSDFGKYNTVNFDTIFSKNVIINYLDNKINGEYADFSIDRNSLIISREVIYTNPENILSADVISVEIDTKDTKIFMYDNNKKVNVRSK